MRYTRDAWLDGVTDLSAQGFGLRHCYSFACYDLRGHRYRLQSECPAYEVVGADSGKCACLGRIDGEDQEAQAWAIRESGRECGRIWEMETSDELILVESRMLDVAIWWGCGVLVTPLLVCFCDGVNQRIGPSGIALALDRGTM